MAHGSCTQHSHQGRDGRSGYGRSGQGWGGQNKQDFWVTADPAAGGMSGVTGRAAAGQAAETGVDQFPSRVGAGMRLGQVGKKQWKKNETFITLFFLPEVFLFLQTT